MQADMSHRGASFIAKRSPANPWQILLDIIGENAGASKDYLFDKFRSKIEDDEDYLRAIAWYFFVNFYEYETTSRSGGRRHKPSDAEKKEERSIVEAIKRKIILMDLALPNGKILRNATFADCTKAGGWFAKLGRKGKPNQCVGKVLTEDQLQKI